MLRKTYPGNDEVEDVREGFDPSAIHPLGDDTEEGEQSSSSQPETTNVDADAKDKDGTDGGKTKQVHYDIPDEERRIWQSTDGKHL